jgi:Zn-dependent protease with chaperone function
MLDLQELEEQADQFALQAGADPNALIGAILKSSAPTLRLATWIRRLLMLLRHRIPPRIHQGALRAFRWFLILDRFLFTDELSASSHPPLWDRMTTILTWKGSDPTAESPSASTT